MDSLFQSENELRHCFLPFPLSDLLFHEQAYSPQDFAQTLEYFPNQAGRPSCDKWFAHLAKGRWAHKEKHCYQ